jgi:hypothetical protein
MGIEGYSESDVLDVLERDVLPETPAAVGGLFPVRGWNGFDWENRGTLFREGLREDTPVHESFSSMRDVVDFVQGTGDYSDSNGFFYDGDDLEELYGEGFFNDAYCHECVEENLEADIGGIVDPRIFPEFRVEEVKSFKPGEEKYRGEMWYQCGRHPEVYLMRSETWYE